MHQRCKLFALVLFTIFSIEAVAHKGDIKMGPILHFNGQSQKNKTWAVSALYLLRHKHEAHPELIFGEGSTQIKVSGEVLGSRFGYDYVRYDMHVDQNHAERRIHYGLPNDDKSYVYTVPAIGENHRILFHSCNGHQSEEDRDAVGGIAPMWQEINFRHTALPYHFQIGGGDQLYADGVIKKREDCFVEPSQGKTFGVFALKSLQPWLNDRDNYDTTPFTDEMRESVRRFYFEHYVRQYNEPDFKVAMATIPIQSTLDDHDYFDGCGSYPDKLRLSKVMLGILEEAQSIGFMVQHQIKPEPYLPTESTPAKPFHFLSVVNDGKLAVLGVDTRTERTPEKIVSQQHWDNIFKQIYNLDASVKHLIVVLGVPVVYALSEDVIKMLDVPEESLQGKMLALMPIVKKLYQKNAWGIWELSDDLRDSWNHPAHRDERDRMIAGFQLFAINRNIRVNFFSGDVHLGGFGIIQRSEERWANDTIAQIISSPVGNITPPKMAAEHLADEGCKLKPVGTDSHMCLQKLTKVSTKKSVLTKLGAKREYGLIAHRNFVTAQLTQHDDLVIEWSAENTKRRGEHRYYYQTVPSAKRSHP